MARSREEHRLASQAGAFESWARTTDRPARTAAARAKFAERFLREAEGDPVRAEALRRAFYARMTLAAAAGRRRAREAREAATLAEADSAAAEATLRDLL